VTFPNPGGSAAIQQNGSAMNSMTGKLNKFGSSGIQKNGSAQNMSGSSAAIKSSAMRKVHSESALTRDESGSGSGIKKSKSGSFGNPPNEEDEIENEISELVSHIKLYRVFQNSVARKKLDKGLPDLTSNYQLR
jgi:hypothetical protein